MYTLEEFKAQAGNLDFQRTNMFSCVFATTPSAKSQQLLNDFGGSIYNILDSTGVNNLFGITSSEITRGVSSLVTTATEKLVQKSGVSKYLIGAMSSRVVQSLLGEFQVGTYLLDFFNMAFPTSGLMVYSVKIPENRLAYEMDKNHNSPGVKITGREHEPLTLSFRMDPAAANYRAMQDWVNSVEDPVTGLRALAEDVEADIQVNLHARNGLPHTVIMFTGCIPIGCGAPELTWDGENTIAVFDVTFAYRVMQTGAVGRQAAQDWLEDKAINAISKINPAQSLNSSLPALSRLGGSASGLSHGISSVKGLISSL